MAHQRLFSAVVLSALVVTHTLTFALPVTQAQRFSDIGQSPYAPAINALADSGVIEGQGGGALFDPSSTINRAEILKIILESLEDVKWDEEGNCFPDVALQWFARYVCTAVAMGIVKGYPSGRFEPGSPTNFVEASKMFALAYDLDIQDTSAVEWFTPFVNAFQGSKVIPPTVGALDAPLKREEMAEIMWRITEEKTDQESKGYLNLKYPELAINLASDEPQRAQSCRDIEVFATEARHTGGGYGGGALAVDEMAVPMMARTMAADSAESAAPAPSAKADFSDTNVQVDGVDEADIVKTDGTYLYAVAGSIVRIVLARPGDELELMSTITLTGDDFHPQDLYIDGDRLILIGSHWHNYDVYPPVKPMPADSARIAPAIWPGPRGVSRAEVRIYNVQDRSNPTLARRVAFDGHTVTSRRIDDKLYLVVNQQTPWYAVPMPRAGSAVSETDGALLPSFVDSARGDVEKPVVACDDVVVLPRVPHPQYLTVAVIPTQDTNASVERTAILGNAQNVYMSLDNLYVASTEWMYNWKGTKRGQSTEKTNVYRFEVMDDGVQMKATGSVPGHILNQFSMDEHRNTFRIATTTGQLWNEDKPSMNNLYILDRESMKRLGEIEEIAPGERIYSTRFVGDRTYMVTFKKVDPFFVIDTKDPKNPRILGKLKIPGYSDYLHPYDENHIIGFGKDAEAAKDADFAWYQGMKIAVFDVTDVSNPRELHKEQIGDRGTDSPLLHNHKALLFDRERNLLAFPITVHQIPENKKSNPTGSTHGDPVFQGAFVYSLTMEHGFEKLGSITHLPDDTFEKAGSHWYNHDRNIQRIVRIGETLLTLSNAAVQRNSFPSVRDDGMLEFQKASDKDVRDGFEDEVFE